jgi:hypothetical protein
VQAPSNSRLHRQIESAGCCRMSVRKPSPWLGRRGVGVAAGAYDTMFGVSMPRSVSLSNRDAAAATAAVRAASPPPPVTAPPRHVTDAAAEVHNVDMEDASTLARRGISSVGSDAAVPPLATRCLEALLPAHTSSSSPRLGAASAPAASCEAGVGSTVCEASVPYAASAAPAVAEPPVDVSTARQRALAVTRALMALMGSTVDDDAPESVTPSRLHATASHTANSDADSDATASIPPSPAQSPRAVTAAAAADAVVTSADGTGYYVPRNLTARAVARASRDCAEDAWASGASGGGTLPATDATVCGTDPLPCDIVPPVPGRGAKEHRHVAWRSEAAARSAASVGACYRHTVAAARHAAVVAVSAVGSAQERVPASVST